MQETSGGHTLETRLVNLWRQTSENNVPQEARSHSQIHLLLYQELATEHELYTSMKYMPQINKEKPRDDNM